eukprot:m.97357 g.97357  ORF g.97357 m.97357 type:complete len:64 (+) comp10211_c0_seq2:1226-1417(+)
MLYLSVYTHGAIQWNYIHCNDARPTVTRAHTHACMHTTTGPKLPSCTCLLPGNKLFLDFNEGQ